MSNDKLTIAQALRRIAKLKGEIAEHEARMKAGVSYVKEEIPAFRFADERVALVSAKAEMLALQSRVAIANALNSVEIEGVQMPLAFAIRTLEELKGEIALLKSLNLRSETVKERTQEWNDEKMDTVIRVNEVTWVSDLSEQDRAADIKKIQNRYETLNNLVEDANHRISL
jgi:hypothetical protein